MRSPVWLLGLVLGCREPMPGDVDTIAETAGDETGSSKLDMPDMEPEACDPAQCGWWEKCVPDSNECEFSCKTSFVAQWDPEAPCEIVPGVPESLAHALEIELLPGQFFQVSEECLKGGWIWTTPWTVMKVCVEDCITFQSLGHATLRWKIPCG